MGANKYRLDINRDSISPVKLKTKDRNLYLYLQLIKRKKLLFNYYPLVKGVNLSDCQRLIITEKYVY